MNILTAVLCALLLSVPLTPAVGAAPKDIYAGWTEPGPPPLERFVEPLRLTLAQQLKLKPIFEDAQVKASQDQGAKGEHHAPNPQLEASVLATRETEFRARLATELTAGQLAQYERLSDAHFARLRVNNPALPLIGAQAPADVAEAPAK